MERLESLDLSREIRVRVWSVRVERVVDSEKEDVRPSNEGRGVLRRRSNMADGVLGLVSDAAEEGFEEGLELDDADEPDDLNCPIA